jgi:integrase
LQAVAGLRAGRCNVQESEPVKPVPQAYVDAAMPFLTAPVAAMVELQLLSAMRPGEAIRMRGRDLDTTGRIWLYKPARHKTAYRGHERTIYLGPRAQSIVKRFLKADLESPLFSPKDAFEAHLAARRAARKTPMTPSQRARKRKSRPKRAPKDHYTLHSYCRSIKNGIDKANEKAKKEAEAAGCEPSAPIPDWHPHQLRHTAATLLRKDFGLDTARCVLGHRSAAVTEVYAELDHDKAIQVIAKVG